MRCDSHSLTLDIDYMVSMGPVVIHKEVEYNYSPILVESVSIDYAPTMFTLTGARKIDTKLDQLRDQHRRKISTQPEGYRQQLVSSSRDKHRIHPKLQAELTEEWDLEDAGNS